MPLAPLTPLENTQFFHQFADQRRSLSGHRNIVGSPRVSADFVFAPPGIPTRLRLHFQEHEIAEPPLVETPRCGEAGNSCAHDHHPDPLVPLRGREGPAIAQPVARFVRIVDEAALDPHVSLGR
jgi:hypothetical protein